MIQFVHDIVWHSIHTVLEVVTMIVFVLHAQAIHGVSDPEDEISSLISYACVLLGQIRLLAENQPRYRGNGERVGDRSPTATMESDEPMTF